ncbi:hypothetical protein V5N11_008491 [Cardamine amara subsp. amara]|uniref:RIN4 pathogenic type III effector avirulence factor Avr cleavage site domain-containing protein n=1 Tax=Cardamine amara subsp. amara TaxID=228776 RepID=A0ABD1AJ58_CARAN
MANRSPVPKFGDWKEDAAFTVVFDKVSKSNSKNNINMSNPNEYPDMNPDAAQNRKYRHDQRPNNNVRARHERLSSREETEYRSSPAHNERNIRVRPPPASDTYNHQSYGGGERSVGNPSETKRRYPQEPVPAQSRPIPNLRNRSKDRPGVSIPPFPGSGSDNQSYTLIFDKVKEERYQSARSYNGISDSTPNRPINDQLLQPLPSSPKGCCFPPWSRK